MEEIDYYDYFIMGDGDGFWTTRDGKHLLVNEMETSHIKNTINLLKRNINKVKSDMDLVCYLKHKIKEFEHELKIREVNK